VKTPASWSAQCSEYTSWLSVWPCGIVNLDLFKGLTHGEHDHTGQTLRRKTSFFILIFLGHYLLFHVVNLLFNVIVCANSRKAIAEKLLYIKAPRRQRLDSYGLKTEVSCSKE
jgi:hypothetical protein